VWSISNVLQTVHESWWLCTLEHVSGGCTVLDIDAVALRMGALCIECNGHVATWMCTLVNVRDHIMGTVCCDLVDRAAHVLARVCLLMCPFPDNNPYQPPVGVHCIVHIIVPNVQHDVGCDSVGCGVESLRAAEKWAFEQTACDLC
jgi:hypothetical protein